MKFSKVGALGLLLLSACGAAREKRLADGSWHIRCGEAMNRCTSRADVLCGDRGYQVISGSTHGKVLGGPNSSYRARVGESELVVQCGPSTGEAAASDGNPENPAGEEPSPSAAGREEPPAKSSACVPGSTQACVGPAGCSGGQACLPDGSGYGMCDCGQSSSAPLPGQPPKGSPTTEEPAGADF